MAYATQSRAFGASFFQKFAELRASMADSFAKYQVYRSTMEELNQLTDRDLSDLGLNRGDIHRVAAEAAYTK